MRALIVAGILLWPILATKATHAITPMLPPTSCTFLILPVVLLARNAPLSIPAGKGRYLHRLPLQWAAAVGLFVILAGVISGNALPLSIPMLTIVTSPL